MALKRCFGLLLSSILALCAHVGGAHGADPVASFTPRTGAWAFDAELNGQPGRGLQIEVRGDTLVDIWPVDARGAF